MQLKKFSLIKYLESPMYKRKFKKYFRRNIFLDTYALCLIIQGEFDYINNYKTLQGTKDDFMCEKTYHKLLRLIECYKGKLVITHAVVFESLNHMFDAIEKKYKDDQKTRKEVEKSFKNFLQKKILKFEEKLPKIHRILNHKFIEKIKCSKLRDIFEIGELSIFLEADGCKYSTIITNDEFKLNKYGKKYQPNNAIVIQLNVLAGC